MSDTFEDRDGALVMGGPNMAPASSGRDFLRGVREKARAQEVYPSLSAFDVNIAVPAVRSSLRIHSIVNEAVVHDTESGTTHHLNATAFHVWSLCDGRRTLGEIGKELAASYNVASDTALQDTEELVAVFAEGGLLESESFI